MEQPEGSALSSQAPNTLLTALLQRMRTEGCPGLCTSASGPVSLGQAGLAPALQQPGLPLPTATGAAEHMTQSGPMRSHLGILALFLTGLLFPEVTGVPPRRAHPRTPYSRDTEWGPGTALWISGCDLGPILEVSCSRVTDFLCFRSPRVSCHFQLRCPPGAIGNPPGWISRLFTKASKATGASRSRTLGTL